MDRICRIYCNGYSHVPQVWINTVSTGTNRLYYIESGTGEYLENGKMHQFIPGKIYFIPYHAGIPTFSSEDDRIYHAYVNFSLSPPIVSKSVLCLDPSASDEIKAALDLFRKLCKTRYNSRLEKDPLPEDKRRKLDLLSAVTLYITEWAINQNPDSLIQDKSIITALDLMHNFENKNLTIADIASKCYLSYDGFIRKFTRYVGETPYTYFKKVKVNNAMRLRAEGVSAEEAAIACGYSDTSSMLHAISSITKKRSSTEIRKK